MAEAHRRIKGRGTKNDRKKKREMHRKIRGEQNREGTTGGAKIKIAEGGQR